MSEEPGLVCEALQRLRQVLAAETDEEVLGEARLRLAEFGTAAAHHQERLRRFYGDA